MDNQRRVIIDIDKDTRAPGTPRAGKLLQPGPGPRSATPPRGETPSVGDRQGALKPRNQQRYQGRGRSRTPPPFAGGKQVQSGGQKRVQLVGHEAVQGAAKVALEKQIRVDRKKKREKLPMWLQKRMEIRENKLHEMDPR